MRKPEADPQSPHVLEPRALELLSGIIEALPDTHQLLSKLMDIAVEALQVERGCMLFFDRADGGYPAIVRNLREGELVSLKAQFSTSAVTELRRAKRVIVAADTSADDRFKDSKSVTQGQILSLLAAPIHVGEELVGAIYLDMRSGRRSFSEEDRRLIEALASLAGRSIEKADMIGHLKHENVSLRSHAYGGILGSSPAMQRVYRALDKIFSNPDAVTVLITGENGTGKSRIARLVHEHSPRAAGPFVVFDSGAVPESLAESELFGHRKGAFTGAIADKPGLLEEADGGTVFIDDVNSLTLSIQAKLLRFLQERAIRPVGGQARELDVRVVCASNADLRALTQQGQFREDLYYRLNFVSLVVPPLRERSEDVPMLARYVLERASQRAGRPLAGFTPEVLARMMGYSWPGNVRELESEIAHAVTMAEGPYVTLGDFKPGGLAGSGAPSAGPQAEPGPALPPELDRAIEELVRQRVIVAIETSGGNVSQAARQLGISRGRLYDLAKRHKLRLA